MCAFQKFQCILHGGCFKIVIFTALAQCYHGEIRLVNGSLPNEGRVEVVMVIMVHMVYLEGKWVEIFNDIIHKLRSTTNTLTCNIEQCELGVLKLSCQNTYDACIHTYTSIILVLLSAVSSLIIAHLDSDREKNIIVNGQQVYVSVNKDSRTPTPVM